jgi:hypothetical protein
MRKIPIERKGAQKLRSVPARALKVSTLEKKGFARPALVFVEPSLKREVPSWTSPALPPPMRMGSMS